MVDGVEVSEIDYDLWLLWVYSFSLHVAAFHQSHKVWFSGVID